MAGQSDPFSADAVKLVTIKRSVPGLFLCGLACSSWRSMCLWKSYLLYLIDIKSLQLPVSIASEHKRSIPGERIALQDEQIANITGTAGHEIKLRRIYLFGETFRAFICFKAPGFPDLGDTGNFFPLAVR